MPILIDAGGTARDVPEELVESALAAGWRPDTNADINARATAAADEAAYGGVGGTVKAGLAGAARGATLGLSDAAIRALGGEDAAIELEGLREQNPIASAVTELGGAIAPALISGGTALPAGAAIRAGRAAGAAAGGGLRGAAVGGALEGGLFGLGQGVSELSLSSDPLTLERAASAIGSNVLFGGLTGGALGAAGNLVERGLSKAGRVLEERIAARQAAGSVTDDLATLDAKGLRAAADTELDALAAAQQAERVAARSSSVDDVLAYRDATREANPWLVIDDPGQRRVLDKAGRSMRGALDDVKGLRENPGLLGKPLRLEEQVLEAAIAKRQTIIAQLDAANVKIADDLAEELATLPGRATSVELTGKMAKRYSAFADVKVAKGGTVSVSREAAAEFADALRTGQVSGASKDALDALDGLLAQNRALQAKIKQATSPIAPRSELVSERLSSIRSAQDVLAMPKPEPGLLQKAATGGVFGAATGLAASIPLIGQIPGAAHLLGAKASDAITGLVFGRIGKATADTAARTKAAVDAFTGAAKAANKYAPPVATKVLGAVRYAAKRDDDEPEPTELPALFKRRTDEIKRLTAYDETGAPRLRPEARAGMAQLFRPVAAVDPIAADRLETIATRRIEYLSSKIPRRP